MHLLRLIFISKIDNRFIMAESDLKRQPVLFTLNEAVFTSLDENLMRLEPLRFCPNVRIDYTAGAVYKLRNNLSPAAILEYHGKLKAAGLEVIDELSFQQCSLGNVEVERYIGPDGADFLADASDEKCMGFYRDVITASIQKVIAANAGKTLLDFSIDPNPYNYVYDPATGNFYYIDYEPSILTHAGGLAHNAFIKFVREKPHLFDVALKETLISYSNPDVTAYIRERPYLALPQLLNPDHADPDQISEHQLVSLLTEQDDIYGATLLIILNVNDRCLERIIDDLGDRFTGYLLKLGSGPQVNPREALIKFLTFQIGAKDPVGLRNYLDFILSLR